MTPQEKRDYQKQWYEKNRAARINQVRKNTDRIRAWFQELKSTLCCVQCGESHPACLDFHHRNATEKTRDVATMVSYGTSIKRILEEISKCDVLCANCHRKLHYMPSSSNGKTPPS